MTASKLSTVQLYVIPWTIVHQAPLSTGFFREKYWNEFLFLPPCDLPDPETETISSALQEGFFFFFLLKDNCFTDFFFLLSIKPQHESVIGIHISTPFWTSLPSPTTFYVSRGIQNPCLSFLSHIFAVSNSKFLLDIYFTYSNVSFHVTLSKHLTFSSPSPPLSPCS